MTLWCTVLAGGCPFNVVQLRCGLLCIVHSSLVKCCLASDSSSTVHNRHNSSILHILNSQVSAGAADKRAASSTQCSAVGCSAAFFRDFVVAQPSETPHSCLAIGLAWTCPVQRAQTLSDSHEEISTTEPGVLRVSEQHAAAAAACSCTDPADDSTDGPLYCDYCQVGVGAKPHYC